ncbi:phosphatase PAP2 family protein [Streptomyces pactum]|uniref:Phosphatase PAP2 family protein n=1 Tax=Streptomyces pactum TaxID=68249 RepID=A0ABS0NFB9_9ACTN|nr:phosphatase PAP2 family protein [Streptomyces pactum]MBH5333893.1 phosphatase PAP2 family protein [Streptomyces pactum]
MQPPSAPSRTRPAGAVRVRRAAAGTAALLTAVFVALLVLVAAGWQPLMDWDRECAEDLHRHAVAHDGWTRTSRVLTDWVWDPWTMRALLAAAVAWLLWRGDRSAAGWVAAAAVLGAVVQQVLKAAVGRERPWWPDPVDSAHYAAFPSGHAFTATVGCGLLYWLAVRYGVRARWRGAVAVVAVVSVLGVGFTRVYLGVHWFSDVLGGWLLGGALVAVVVAWCPAPGPVPRAPDRRRDHVGRHPQ